MSWGAIKLRLRGTDGLVFDGEASPAPGGGSMTKQEFAGGPATDTIADGASAFLTLAHVSGDALLDYTDPTKPTIIEGDTYAAFMNPACMSGSQLGGFFVADLFMDDGGASGAPVGNIEVPLTNVGSPNAVFSATWKLPAGTVLDQLITNNEGLGDALDFLGQLWLVKLS